MATESPPRAGLLRHHADFRRLWLGEGISLVGTQVSLLALPLVAVTDLHASTFEVAVLTATEMVAFLFLGLPAGAWSDRMRRRPVLIVGDLGRVVILASVPLAALAHVLTIWQLYVVGLAAGVCTVFFDIAYQSYLPALVGRDRLVEGNAKLETNRTVAGAVGPTVGGFLVQGLTAPIAVAVDALSFAWSAAWIAAIRTPEAAPRPAARPRLRTEIGEGLRFVFGHPILRAITLCGATAVVFYGAQGAIVIVFLVREVQLSPGAIGVLFSISSAGTILGALSAAWLTRALGQRRAMVVYVVGAGLAGLLIPLTAGGWRLAFFALGAGLVGYFIVAYNILQVSLRQTVCPDHLLGRMNATMRTTMWSTTPLGAVLGGLLGSSLGLRPTLWIAAVGALLASPLLLPIMREPLEPAAGGTPAGREMPEPQVAPDDGELVHPGHHAAGSWGKLGWCDSRRGT